MLEREGDAMNFIAAASSLTQLGVATVCSGGVRERDYEVPNPGAGILLHTRDTMQC
jgi:hypothetical protein